MKMSSEKIAAQAVISGLLLSACWGCGQPNVPGAPPSDNPAPPSVISSPENAPTSSESTPAVEASTPTSSPEATSDKKEAGTVAETSTTTGTNSSTPQAETAGQETPAAQSSQAKTPDPPKGSASPMPTPSIVPNPSAKPITIWETSAEKTLRQAVAGKDSAEKYANPNSNFSFSAPLSWNIGQPKGFPNVNSIIMWPSGNGEVKPSTPRILVIPWSIYNQALNEEVQKAEVSWFFSQEVVQSATLTGQETLKVGKYEAIRNTYSVILLNNPDELQLVATYVDAKPTCYAVIMATPLSRLTADTNVYKQLLQSLTISAVPASVKQTPPPDRKPADAAPANKGKPGANASGRKMESDGKVHDDSKAGDTQKVNQLKPNMPLPKITTAPATPPAKDAAKDAAKDTTKASPAADSKK